MSDHDEEQRVKARHHHDTSKQYYRRSYKKTMRKKELPKADMTIESAHSLVREEESLDDDDVGEQAYIPSPQTSTHGKGKWLASGSGSRDEKNLEEEEEGEDEIFDVGEINPHNYVHMGTPTFTQPQNPGWRTKVNYKGKTEAVREKRRENPKLK
jgi:hypothetical protein